MFKLTIPPSSNWNCSRIIDCNNSGVVTYASRNDLIVIKTEVTNTGFFDVRSIHTAHKEKILNVILSPDSYNRSNCVATCSEDGSVVVWDLETLSPKQSHSGHQEGKKILGLDWSHADPNLVVSVSEEGTVICWDLESNTIRRLPALYKISPLCLACSPHNKDIIAVGGKLGYLQVVDIKGNGKVVFHTRGHATDLVSLSWCPALKDVFDTSGVKVSASQLLATGALERNIFIWEIGNGRKNENTLSLPNSPMGGHAHRKKLSPSWICVKWIDSNRLLSSSQFGELVCWDLQSTSNMKCGQQKNRTRVEPKMFHDYHSKQLFAIGCPTFYRELDMKSDKVGIWSVSADKQIVWYSLNNEKAEHIIPTIGGVVHCMAFSVYDSNRLAIGTGDHKVLIWNMYDTSKLDITIHWNKIIGKVLSLAWHPSEEHWLACGTSFGRVILLDVRPGREPTEFHMCRQEAVHELHWAPPLIHTDTEIRGKQKSALALFAVADGRIAQYDIRNTNKEPVLLDEILKQADLSSGHSSALQRINFAFKPDKTVFAVGNHDGSVHIIKSKDLSHSCTVYAHRKSMNSLAWHPETVASYNEISPYKNWLAVAADGIKVYDVIETTAQLVADLAMHAAKVTCIAWSHHFNARLVSASYDTSVQVWDVIQKTLLGTFVMHKNHVMACLFSPFDPNFIISASSDYTVKVWSMKEEPVSPPLPKVLNRSVKAMKERGSGAQAVESVQSPQLKQNKDTVKQPTSKQTSLESNRKQQIEASEEIKFSKRKFIFPVIGNGLHTAKSIDKLYNRWLENQAGGTDADKLCTINLTNSSDEELTSESLLYLDFFGDRKAMRNILKMEEKKFADQGRTANSQYTALWRGDVTEMIQEATKKKKLSDWVVSIAASASQKVWKETCEAYAAQLAEEGQYQKASTYLLAVNKIEEAINLLVEQNLFVEAVAVTKCRLPENNPIIESILKKWADFSCTRGQCQLAAHCYLAAGELLSASDILARCSDLKSLLMSAILAAQAGALDLANARAKECLNISVQTNNWHIAELLLTKYDDLKYYGAWFETSKIISGLKKKKKLTDEVFQWLHGECDGQMLLEKFKTSFTVSENMYTKLKDEVEKIKSPMFEKEMWHSVSGQLATAAAAFHESGRITSDVIRHLVKALAMTGDFQPTKHESAPSIQLCFWLSPKGPFSEESVFVSSCETKEEEELSKSLGAYLGSTVCQWLSTIANVKSIPENSDKNTVIENGADYKKLDNDLKWLIKLIETCYPYILDKESIEYFKIKMRRQLLLEQKSKETANKTVFNKKSSKEENKNKQKNTSKNKKNFSEIRSKDEETRIGRQEVDGDTVCNESIPEIDDRQTQEDAALVNQVDCTRHEGDLIQNVKHDIQVGNGDVNEHVLLQESGDSSVRGFSNLCVKESSCDDDEDDGDKSIIEEDLFVSGNKNTETTGSENSKINTEDIQQYDVFIQQFEKKRVSVPNPYVAYSQLKTVISKYIEPCDSHMAKILNEKCDNLWVSCL